MALPGVWLVLRKFDQVNTPRFQDFKIREGNLKAAKTLLGRGITYLAIIGGDGSLTGANRFKGEWSSFVNVDIWTIYNLYNIKLYIGTC